MNRAKITASCVVIGSAIIAACYFGKVGLAYQGPGGINPNFCSAIGITVEAGYIGGTKTSNPDGTYSYTTSGLQVSFECSVAAQPDCNVCYTDRIFTGDGSGGWTPLGSLTTTGETGVYGCATSGNVITWAGTLANAPAGSYRIVTDLYNCSSGDESPVETPDTVFDLP
jgi:hypothetical protein